MDGDTRMLWMSVNHFVEAALINIFICKMDQKTACNVKGVACSDISTVPFSSTERRGFQDSNLYNYTSVSVLSLTPLCAALYTLPAQRQTADRQS